MTSTMFFKISTTLTLLSLTCSMSLHAHRQASPDLNTYEASLTALHSNFRQSLTKLISLTNGTLQQTASVGSNPVLSKTILESAISHQNQIAASILGNYSLQQFLKTSNCLNMTQADQSILQMQIEQLTAKVADLESLSQPLIQCPRTDVIAGNILLLKAELSNLKKQTANICPFTNNTSGSNITNTNSTLNATNITNTTLTNGTSPQPTFNPNNLPLLANTSASSNWIYGSTSPLSYEAKVSQLIAQGSPTCPPTTPFISPANTCISCTNTFDLSSNSCVDCPNGYSLNSTLHQCMSNGQTYVQNSNSAAENYAGKKEDYNPSLTNCTASSSFWTGTACLTCSLPSYFDFNSRTCQQCTDTLIFNTTSRSCRPAPVVMKNPALSPNTTNYIGTAPQPNTSLDSCASSQPYFNGKVCISCASPLYFFDFQNLSCNACPALKIFNSSSKSCVTDPKYQYYQSSLAGVTNFKGSQSSIPVGMAVLNCASSSPFSNGQACLACNSPSFFNFLSNQCEVCAAGSSFSTASQDCKPNPGSPNTLMNSNVVNASNYMYTIPSFNSTYGTCLSTYPFFNGINCVACALPHYFNFNSLQCEICHSASLFNPVNHQCEFTNQSYVTNLADPNIYYNDNYTQVQVDLAAKVAQSKGVITVCPLSSPYYDATKNQCISCLPSQVYNIKYNQCTTCGEGTTFFTQTHTCMNSLTVSPTIERMLMNTVGIPFFS